MSNKKELVDTGGVEDKLVVSETFVGIWEMILYFGLVYCPYLLLPIFGLEVWILNVGIFTLTVSIIFLFSGIHTKIAKRICTWKQLYLPRS